MGLSRREFTKEFKLAAVRRLEQGVSVAEVARGFCQLKQGKGNLRLSCQPLGVPDLLQAAVTLFQIAKERERSHR